MPRSDSEGRTYANFVCVRQGLRPWTPEPLRGESERQEKEALAVYHLSVKAISRAAGRSATAAAAYRAGEEITDDRTGQVHDYSRKGGVESAELVLPADAPAWAGDRGALWNAAEHAETRKNSTVAREFEVALPAELSPEGRRRLAQDFAREIVARHGIAADVAIHAPGREGDHRNHHAHILLSTRRFSPDGFGPKSRELDERKSGEVERWRERWAELANQALEREGHAARIDHRSLEAQGIERAPTEHQGPALTGMARRGEIGQVAERRAEETEARRFAAGEVERIGRELAQGRREMAHAGADGFRAQFAADRREKQTEANRQAYERWKAEKAEQKRQAEAQEILAKITRQLEAERRKRTPEPERPAPAPKIDRGWSR